MGRIGTLCHFFNGPNALTTVNFQAIAGTTSPGTGFYATKDNTGKGGALVFGPGALSGARTGTLILVFDVNFLLSPIADSGESVFASNLIAYLAAPVPLVSGPLPPTAVLVLLGLASIAGFQFWRRVHSVA